jgi:hypothetical protein
MWLIVSDRTARVVGYRTYSAGIDLEALFAQIVREVSDSGWTVEEHLPYMASFFCHAGTQRLFVRLQPTVPHHPLAEWPLPAPATSIVGCLPDIESLS